MQCKIAAKLRSTSRTEYGPCYLELRAEAINVSNTPILNGPSDGVLDTTPGQITSSQGERNIQLALKFNF